MPKLQTRTLKVSSNIKLILNTLNIFKWHFTINNFDSYQRQLFSYFNKTAICSLSAKTIDIQWYWQQCLHFRLILCCLRDSFEVIMYLQDRYHNIINPITAISTPTRKYYYQVIKLVFQKCLDYYNH